jgi:hypothetical protein
VQDEHGEQQRQERGQREHDRRRLAKTDVAGEELAPHAQPL